ENPLGTIQSRIVTAHPVGHRTDQSKTFWHPIRLQPQMIQRASGQTIFFQQDFANSTPPHHSPCPSFILQFSFFFAISTSRLLVLRASVKLISPNKHLTYNIAM
ncbi:hypothetical protein O181_086315, partial [Austropuccinia psidii MF-1]|nr:hypothetical protein [Austropuccinia psidii MF-1]